MRDTGGAMIDHAAAKQPIEAAGQARARRPLGAMTVHALGRDILTNSPLPLAVKMALGRRIVLLPAAAGAGIGNRMSPPPDLEGQPLHRRICITNHLRNRGTGS